MAEPAVSPELLVTLTAALENLRTACRLPSGRVEGSAHEVLSLANLEINLHSPSQPTPRAQALPLDSRDPRGHPETFRSCLHPSVGLHVAVTFWQMVFFLHFLTSVA